MKSAYLVKLVALCIVMAAPPTFCHAQGPHKYEIVIDRSEFGASLTRQKTSGAVDFTFYTVPDLPADLTAKVEGSPAIASARYKLKMTASKTKTKEKVQFDTPKGRKDAVITDWRTVNPTTLKLRFKSNLDFTLQDLIERTIENNPPINGSSDAFKLSVEFELELDGHVATQDPTRPLEFDVIAIEE